MFAPRLALASLSGESDAAWARAGAPYAGAAFLGGIAICERTRAAAREMEDRDRTEFLPPDPVAFVDAQFRDLVSVPIRPGINVRAADPAAIPQVARTCARHGAIYEVNAHCRQAEMCAAGAGKALLADADRLEEQVRRARETGATVSVKVRAEVPNVELPAVGKVIAEAGGTAIHVDAMDSESVVADIAAATDLFIIANNGVRDRETVAEYLEYGADAVSVGRPSDRPEVLARVRHAVEALDPRSTGHEIAAGNDR